MADIFAAEIIIGGTIPESKIYGLILAITKQRLFHDWGDDIVKIQVPDRDAKSCERKILKYLVQHNANCPQPDREGRLHFCNHKARCGEFQIIERFCEKHRIGYTRISSSNFAYDSERKEYRLNMGAPAILPTNQCGAAVVPIMSLRPLLDMDSTETIKTCILDVVRLEDIPALDPFEIIDG